MLLRRTLLLMKGLLCLAASRVFTNYEEAQGVLEVVLEDVSACAVTHTENVRGPLCPAVSLVFSHPTPRMLQNSGTQLMVGSSLPTNWVAAPTTLLLLEDGCFATPQEQDLEDSNLDCLTSFSDFVI